MNDTGRYEGFFAKSILPPDTYLSTEVLSSVDALSHYLCSCSMILLTSQYIHVIIILI